MRRITFRPILISSILFFLFFLGCHSKSTESFNLLKGLQPFQQQGIFNTEKITDGIASKKGGEWNSELASVFQSPSGFLVYDFGQVSPIHSLYIQADNNDTYLFSISSDGEQWTPLWQAPAMNGAGMRERMVQNLHASARFLKISAEGGDGRYSIGEIQVFAEKPVTWPPSIIQKGSQTFQWTFGEQETLQLKALVALLAIIILVSMNLPYKIKLNQKLGISFLALLALISVGVYYHFGHLQFRNVKSERQTMVHLWDMRVYFPVAKYFEELHFNGLYLACLQAYLDDHPNTTETELSQVRLRNLNNNEIDRGIDVVTDAQNIKSRFTPERWKEFRHDMRWFEEAMGSNDYLGSMTDHGGNATPVWMLGAHYLFKKSKDIEKTLSLTALLDPLLLLFLFVVIGRTFGLVPMFVCMIVFGCTDYYRFGSNLAGSTLRQDWLVAMGLGVCALRTKKHFLGGILIAYSALIRAFPATAVFFLGAPLLWELPDLSSSKKIRPFLKTALGVLVCVSLLFTLTSLKFSYKNSWQVWFQKITLHADKPNVNHLGFRNLFSYDPDKTSQKLVDGRFNEPWTEWQRTQKETFQNRRPYYLAAIFLMLAALLCACRKKNLYQSALMGLMFIPVIFYPANYYFHYIFLLPLLGIDEKDDGSSLLSILVSSLLLGMCSIQYLTLLEPQGDVSFTYQSWLLIGGFVAILGVVLLEDLRPHDRTNDPS